MQEVPNKRQPETPPRSQGPLWIAIVGLVVTIYSLGMKDEMIQDVVFWFGLVCAVIGVLYWIIRPQHGIR